MARIGISITKSVAFRNSTQEFTNVYYYDGGVPLPLEAEADGTIDELVTLEKTFHSTDVNFVRGRLWSQGPTPALSNMISQKTLSGTGARAPQSGLDRERAFLFRVRAGNDSRGNPVYLRKWYHSCGLFFLGQVLSTGVLANQSGFSAGDKTSMVNAMDGVSEVGPAGARTICAKSGREPDETANWTSHNFLEHHQLGDMWRAQ